jgi:hypothetical protein
VVVDGGSEGSSILIKGSITNFTVAFLFCNEKKAHRVYTLIRGVNKYKEILQ